MKTADGVLFVTPEYNRSVPGVLKNAIDVGSRPYGQSAWDRQARRRGQRLARRDRRLRRQSSSAPGLVFLNMPTMQQPEAYIGGADKLFDADGKLTNDGTRSFLQQFMECFAAWVDDHPA